MKILLIGSTGIVGDGIKRFLLENNILLNGTSRKAQEIELNFSPIQIDLTSSTAFEELQKTIPNVDAIIYNAAIIPSTNRGGGSFDDSLELHALLLNKILLYNQGLQKKIVYISGYRLATVNKNKIEENIPFTNYDTYSTTKLFGELLCNQFILNGDKNISVLRVNAPFGYVNSTNSVLPLFLDKVLKSENIQLIGKGERRQVFTFSEDIGYAALLAIRSKFTGFLTITSDFNFSMNELAFNILKNIPTSTTSILFSDEEEHGVNKTLSISIDKAKKEIGFQPLYTFDTVINKIIKNNKK